MTEIEEKLVQIVKEFPEGIYLGSNCEKERNCSITYLLNKDTNIEGLKQKLSTIIANNVETYDLFDEIMFLAAVKMKLKIQSN